MVEQPPPAGVGGADPVRLGPADWIEEGGRLRANQQVLASVDRHAEMTAVGQGAEPGPLGRGPGAEADRARRVRLLVARLVQAGQGAVWRPCQQGAILQE